MYQIHRTIDQVTKTWTRNTLEEAVEWADTLARAIPSINPPTHQVVIRDQSGRVIWVRETEIEIETTHEQNIGTSVRRGSN
jgi:hypothetical protein